MTASKNTTPKINQIIGLKEINYTKQEGRKMAITGIVFSRIGIGLPILLIAISFMAFSLF